MSKFKITKLDIEGLLIIEPTVFGDDRGYFYESYNKKELEEVGFDVEFIQDNQSKSKKGVLRGLHYQKTKPQGKLVRVISGKVIDIALDIRKDSKTFGKWYSIELSAENKKQLYVPEGFAHGFVVISDYAEFLYKVTDYYDPSDEAGILYNDPTLNIDWGNIEEVILSDKDKVQPLFKDIKF